MDKFLGIKITLNFTLIIAHFQNIKLWYSVSKHLLLHCFNTSNLNTCMCAYQCTTKWMIKFCGKCCLKHQTSNIFVAVLWNMFIHMKCMWNCIYELCVHSALSNSQLTFNLRDMHSLYQKLVLKKRF